jgi:hypothetical protein
MTLLLLLVLAVAAVAAAPVATVDIPLPLGDGVYNPSVAVHAGHAYVAARATRLRWDASGLKWIVNRAYLCAFPLAAAISEGGSSNNNNSSTSLPPPSLSWVAMAEAEIEAEMLGDGAVALPPARRCVPLDPWAPASAATAAAGGPSTSYVECRATPSSGRDPWDATGVDDTKLFVWPGRGLWAITGRRPPPPPHHHPARSLLDSSARFPPSRRCAQPVIWRQFLFQLTPEGEPVDLAAWADKQQVAGGRVAVAADDDGDATTAAALSSRPRAPQHNGSPPPLPDTGGFAWAPDPPKYRPFGVSEGWWWGGGGGGGGSLEGDATATSTSGGEFRPMFAALRPGEEGVRQQEHWEMEARWRAGRRRRGVLRRRNRRMKRRHHRRPPAAVAAAAASASAATANPEHRDWAWEAAARAPPLQLALADAFDVYGRGYDIYEKNWMPLALPAGGGGGGEEDGGGTTAQPLYVVHSLHPYRVYELAPNGTALPLLADASAARQATERALREALAAGGSGDNYAPSQQLLARVHGGPPVVYYAPSSGRPRLLGVLHYWLPRGGGGGGGRSYHHRLFEADAAPPFAVARVARRELPLVDGSASGGGGGGGIGSSIGRKRRRERSGGAYASVAFASGLLHDRGGATADGEGGGGNGGNGNGAVVVTYGAGDAASRALVLTEREVEAMFG